MTLYGISSEWDCRAYQRLLAAAMARGGYCVLVCRAAPADACLRWLHRQEDSLESSRKSLRWPGTVVFDEADCATLFKFRVTSQLIRALQGSVAGPFDWLGPDLPEDLSFLREDGRPWFVSIAHERDAFFKLQMDEVSELRRRLGDVELIAQGDDQVPEESY